jgi:tellurite resistance protein TerC
MTFSNTSWILFISFIIIALIIDLGVFSKKPKAVPPKTAAMMTMIWVLSASIFCSIIYFSSGRQLALEFITGYIIELTLSMDNVFVFILIFTYFKTPQNLQHRVLFWGIIGAIVMRFGMIMGGIELFSKFRWMFYIFGAFLIYSGLKIALFKSNENASLKNNKVLKFIKRKFNVTEDYEGKNFFVKRKGKIYITPLFLTLVFIEKTDLIFALDSIPAILAITQNSFIVFTSNIFAILGLRSLYFLLLDLSDRFDYLKYGIGVILSFVGTKMILSMHGYHVPTAYSLLFIGFTLSTSIITSFLMSKSRR